MLLSQEVAQAAESSVLCWLATVSPDGQPHVSPKEIFCVLDGQHIVVAHIASPTTASHVQACPQVCVSFVDVFVQKGFKVLGAASYVDRNHPEFLRWADTLLQKAGPRFPVHGVIVVLAQSVSPILAPSYRLYPDTSTEADQVASALRTYRVTRAGLGRKPLD